MKKEELNCPICQGKLVDLKSSLNCDACQKHFQVKISRKGVQQFLYLFLPSCFVISTVVVMNWKVAGFLNIPNRELAIFGLIGLGVVGLAFSIVKMKSEFEVGEELQK